MRRRREFRTSIPYLITDRESFIHCTGGPIRDGDRQIAYRRIATYIQIRAECPTHHRTDSTQCFHRRCRNFDIALGMVSTEFYGIIWIVNTPHNIGSMDIVHFGSRCRNHIWILSRIHRFDSRVANCKSAISGVDRGIAHSSTHSKGCISRTDIHRDIIFVHSEVYRRAIAIAQSRINANSTSKARAYNAIGLCILDGRLDLVIRKLHTSIFPSQSSEKTSQVTILVCSAVVSRLESYICIRYFKNRFMVNGICRHRPNQPAYRGTSQFCRDGTAVKGEFRRAVHRHDCKSDNSTDIGRAAITFVVCPHDLRNRIRNDQFRHRDIGKVRLSIQIGYHAPNVRSIAIKIPHLRPSTFFTQSKKDIVHLHIREF